MIKRDEVLATLRASEMRYARDFSVDSEYLPELMRITFFSKVRQFLCPTV